MGSPVHDPPPGGLTIWCEAARVRYATIPFAWVQIAVALALAGSLTLAFFGLDYLNLARHRAGVWMWDPCLACEVRLPYAPAWIWVYLAYYPLCFAPLFLSEVRREPGVFWRVVGAYLMQFTLCFALFLLLPTRMTRPPVGGEGLTRAAMEWTYLLDPGFNIFPSLHVSVLVFTSWLFGRFGGTAAARACWAATVLIAASTLLVKQHCLLDLVAGAAVGTAASFASSRSAAGSPKRA